MALITWDEKLSVHDDEMDNHHKVLIGLINELHAAMKEGHGRIVLVETLNRLMDYTVFHFTAEENILAAGGYPATPEHMAEHQRFIERMNKFRTDFAAEKAGISIELINYLSDWLRGHILVSDKKYSDFFSTQE